MRGFELIIMGEIEVGYDTKSWGDVYYIGDCKKLMGVLDQGHIVELGSPMWDERRIWRERERKITREHR